MPQTDRSLLEKPHGASAFSMWQARWPSLPQPRKVPVVPCLAMGFLFAKKLLWPEKDSRWKWGEGWEGAGEDVQALSSCRSSLRLL